MSSAIAPFDLRQGREFAPSFLSGFYADTNDVEKHVYLQEAEDIVVRHAADQLARDSVCRKYHAEAAEGGQRIRNALRPAERTSELAMLPVWFLSYRNGDRVSYAVVNGQTGKAAADLPVDMKKYLKKPFGGGHFKEKWRTLIKPLAGIVLAAVILLVDPVSDWFYYIGAFACMDTVLWAILDIIRQHNMLTTRRLPQLNRRGGDENE